MNKTYAPLHTHTKFSLLDGMSSIEDIIKKCKDNNISSIAITDHGNIDYATECYKQLNKNDIKYIHGVEAYICDDINVKNKQQKYNHIILLCKNEESRILLNKIITKSYKDGFYYKPRIDFSMIEKYSNSFVVLSACMAGEIQRALMKDDYDLAKIIANKYKDTFGDNFYLEYQSHSEEKQQELNRKIVNLAKELNIKTVITTDSHYTNKEDKKYHSYFVKIGQMREVGETYNDCYIQSYEEILSICKSTTREENESSLRNTLEISEKCNVEIPLSAPIIPHIEVPDGFKTERSYMLKLCKDGWVKRKIGLKKNKKEYSDRLKYEVDAITKMRFEGYYLLVESYANSVKRRGIARGSGGGSLVAYLMNIVDIDPIEYGLYFERFIDVGALDLLEKGIITEKELKIPDFDLDFGKKDREILMDFIVDKYGEDRVASIGSYQYLKAKSAIKDICKILREETEEEKYSFEKINEITKNIDQDITISKALELGVLDDYRSEYEEVFDIAEKIAGLPKAFSIHPCGKVIATKDLDYFMPISPDKNGIMVLRGDMYSVDDLGMVKIDVLGLRTIDVIYDVLEMINKDYNYIDPSKLNLKDKKVLDEFAKGVTDGIFQFESDGMKKTLIDMKVDCLDDLISANALYRPGSKDYIPNYCRRKNKEEEIVYLHEDLIPILNNTYGIIVFQEQLIEIGRLAKLKNPDKLRKATGKKIQSLLEEVWDELKKGLEERDWNKKQLNQLWEDMLKFAKYSFNKSHSGAYALIAYITMFLKVYHPNEFYCCLFNSNIGKINKISTCYYGKPKDVKIEKIRIGKNNSVCELGEKGIKYGLSLIKNINHNTAMEVNEIYKNNKNTFPILYRKIKQETSLNSKQVETLVKIGFFEGFGSIKKILTFIEWYDKLKNKTYKKENIEQELEMYIKDNSDKTDKMYRNLNKEIILENIWNDLPNKEFDAIDLIRFENEYLGYIIDIPDNISIGQIEMVSTKYKSANIKSLRTFESRWFKFKKVESILPKRGDTIIIHDMYKKIGYKGRMDYYIQKYEKL